MVKNEERTGVVLRLGSNGEGIIKDENFTVFVPFVLVGEKVKYKVLKVKGNIAFGKAIEILTPAEERVRPRCHVFGKCGGCQLQHLKYKEQLKFKGKAVKDCLSKVAFIETEVPPAVKSPEEYNYRNKLQLPVREENGVVKIGFFAPNSHRIVETTDCPIQKGAFGKIVETMKKYISQSGITAYNEEKKSGKLKHLVIRFVEDCAIITLVLSDRSLPQKELIIDLFKGLFEKFSLYINVNKNDNNVILGDEFILVYGSEKYECKEMGVIYEMGPRSFMQVNDGMRSLIYKEAFAAAEIDENTVVIDAYSGAGLLTAMFAKSAKKAIGIEIVKEAVEIADKLKADNALEDKMENVCAPCEEVLPNILKREKESGAKCVLILDPPRQGVDVAVINAIKESLPDRIVYISCSPQTLSRDLGLLTGTLADLGGGSIGKNPVPETPLYDILSVKPMDMFPQTKHVETVTLLSRRKDEPRVQVTMTCKSD